MLERFVPSHEIEFLVESFSSAAIRSRIRIACAERSASTAVSSNASREALELTAVEADLSAQAILILDRIAAELKDSTKNSISWDGTNRSSIRFQKCVGFGAESIELGNVIEYATYFDPGTGKYLCRRTEWDPSGVQITDLTDSLTPTGLSFDMASPGKDVLGQCDVWRISVQVANDQYAVVRNCPVQLKF